MEGGTVEGGTMGGGTVEGGTVDGGKVEGEGQWREKGGGGRRVVEGEGW